MELTQEQQHGDIMSYPLDEDELLLADEENDDAWIRTGDARLLDDCR